jgi:hypothetical protein
MDRSSFERMKQQKQENIERLNRDINLTLEEKNRFDEEMKNELESSHMYKQEK